MKRLSVFIALLLTAPACRDRQPTEPSGPVLLTSSPLPYEAIRQAMPLGNTNPPGHTFPTSHIGFYLNGTDPVEVRAVAAGKIRTIYFNTGFGDNRIEFEHTSTFLTVLDHVRDLVPGIVEGKHVEAGTLLGYGDPNVSAVDLGVVDYDVTLSFITPSRYHDFDLHCADPYEAFTSGIRDALLVTNPRTVEPRGGRIDFDIDGTLSGNWFHESLPVKQTSGYNYAHGHLAFIRDDVDPAEIRITCGGTLETAPFDRSIAGNAPDPADITPSSGMVKFALVTRTPAVLLVQMTGNRALKAEVFSNQTPTQVTAFTQAAQNYIR